MIKEISPRELSDLIDRMYEHTNDSWNKILESLSRLKNIECYKEIGLYSEKKLKDYARTLN